MLIAPEIFETNCIYKTNIPATKIKIVIIVSHIFFLKNFTININGMLINEAKAIGKTGKIGINTNNNKK